MRWTSAGTASLCLLLACAVPLPATAQAPAPPAAAPDPAAEPEALRRLRAVLGPDTRLRYAAADAIDPARDALRLRGVVLERPERTAEIAELILDGLRDDGVAEAVLREVAVRETGSATVTTIDRLRIAGLTVPQPPPGQAMRPDGLRLDALRLEGLGIQGDTPAAVAVLDLEDYGAGRQTRLTVEGLELRQPDATATVDRVSLGRLSLRGVDLAGTAAALMEKQRPPQAAGASAFEAADIVLRRGDRRVAALDALSLTGETPAPGVPGPETGRVALRGITVEPFPEIAAWMQRFGYTTLVGDLTADIRMDRAAGLLDIAAFSLGARDIGALGLALAMDGLDFDAMTPEAMTRGRFVSLRLRFVDQSLYGRFVSLQAKEMRRSEQQVREMFADQARALFERPPGAGPRGGAPKGGIPGGGAAAGAATAEMGAAVQRFLRGEAREIEVSARPAKPVPFLELQQVAPAGPDAVQRALGLTVTTR